MQPNNSYGSSTSISPNGTHHRHANTWLIISVILFLLFVGVAIFAGWAYMGRKDYKNNSDQKASTAAEIAKKQAETTKDNEFLEKEKQPLKDYLGPAQYGSVKIKYPKTWSAYVVESSSGSSPVDGFFHPNFVPNAQVNTVGFALRVQVISTAYDQQLKSYDSAVKAGKAKVSPYKPALVPNVTGARIDGEIITGKQGSMILLPLRDKTVKLWTEANQFLPDFDTNILPNFTFSP